MIQEQTNGLPKSATESIEQITEWLVDEVGIMKSDIPKVRYAVTEAHTNGWRSRDAEIAEQGSLVATREAMIAALDPTRDDGSRHTGTPHDGRVLNERQAEAIVDALLASGVVREVGVVEAEQREKDAVIAESHRPEVGTHINVSEYRTGKYDAATIIAASIRGGEKK